MYITNILLKPIQNLKIYYVYYKYIIKTNSKFENILCILQLYYISAFPKNLSWMYLNILYIHNIYVFINIYIYIWILGLLGSGRFLISLPVACSHVRPVLWWCESTSHISLLSYSRIPVVFLKIQLTSPSCSGNTC